MMFGNEMSLLISDLCVIFLIGFYLFSVCVCVTLVCRQCHLKSSSFVEETIEKCMSSPVSSFCSNIIDIFSTYRQPNWVLAGV